MRLAGIGMAAVLLAAVPAFGFDCPALGVGAAASVEKMVPAKNFPELGGKAIGVLVTGIAPALKAEDRSVPDEIFGFGVDRSSYFLPWVKDRKNAAVDVHTFAIGKIVAGGHGAKQVQYRELALPVTESLTAFNIKRKFQLVEVEVNDGDGSPKGSSEFLATKLTVLDKTKDYPLDVEQAVTDATTCFEKEVKESQKQFDRQLARAQLAVLGGEGKATGPVEDALLKLPTWNATAKTLDVQFVFTRTNGDYKETDKGVRSGVQFGMRVGATYAFDAEGKVKDSFLTPVILVKRELVPPKAPGPVAPPPVGKFPPVVPQPVAPPPVVPKPGPVPPPAGPIPPPMGPVPERK